MSLRRVLLITLTAGALALTGCATAAPPVGTSPAPQQATAGFPRTLDVPAGATTKATTLRLEREPKRIAALSYETAALAVELGIADRLVVIPREAANPALSAHAKTLAAVPTTIPTVAKFDPETIIAAQPDLVLLTARHGLEASTAEALRAAGIAVLVLPNAWSTPEEVAADVKLVGAATGTDPKATALAASLAEGLDGSPAQDGPSVLVLSNQAGRPFVTAGRAFPLALLGRAGAVDASRELGMKTTGPITAEQVVSANPDGLLLIDMNGSGRGSFDALLANPAVAALPAVQQGRVHLVSGKSVQALGLSGTVPGLADLKRWVAELR